MIRKGVQIKLVTITTLGFVIATAWFVSSIREEADQKKVLSVHDASGQDAAIPLKPVEEDEPINREGIDRGAATPASEHADANVPTKHNDAVIRLFSEPEYGTDEYRNARDLAGTFLAGLGSPGALRNQLLKSNDASIDEFVRQFEESSDGLRASFDVSPFGDVPCTVSSIETTMPSFTPGVQVTPDMYNMETKCDDTRMRVTASINKRQRSVRFSIVGPGAGSFAIVRLKDSEYSVAYQLEPLSYSLQAVDGIF